MAGWSIAQNPLLLPGDQPCNVLGNFCNGLTHCQQPNLSGFLHKDTSAPHKVTAAGIEYPCDIVEGWKKKKAVDTVWRTIEVDSRATYYLCGFHGWSCWTGFCICPQSCRRHFASCKVQSWEPADAKFMILFLGFESAFTGAGSDSLRRWE